MPRRRRHPLDVSPHSSKSTASGGHNENRSSVSVTTSSMVRRLSHRARPLVSGRVLDHQARTGG
ncbi:hypothetical protein I545_5299 [Mycobacterium kansasii 662]|uniref:Uncharacterized protein n=2 Tax=Mycobacterium kansasii TaxID=1768 RepID=A0A1V3WJ43_MYCKA|nr:hypothetical protein I547_1611 [Mycobacterium kansasii 824]EUA11744.1 hypothetical protein I545_5299 [Mycobacterium kansasii 662]OOK66970.1 hypothetical protein BZL29_7229 [Mycobacterium kansasii]